MNDSPVDCQSRARGVPENEQSEFLGLRYTEERSKVEIKTSTLRRSDETKSRFSHQSAVPTAKRRCLCCRFSLFCSRWHSFVMNTRTSVSVHKDTHIFYLVKQPIFDMNTCIVSAFSQENCRFFF